MLVLRALAEVGIFRSEGVAGGCKAVPGCNINIWIQMAGLGTQAAALYGLERWERDRWAAAHKRAEELARAEGKKSL